MNCLVIRKNAPPYFAQLPDKHISEPYTESDLLGTPREFHWIGTFSPVRPLRDAMAVTFHVFEEK